MKRTKLFGAKAEAESATRRLPLARSTELVVEQLESETLVYDERILRAHCLSAEAARVWRRCDGRTSPAALATELDLDEDTVHRALDELTECELLEADAPQAGGSTRREVTLRVAKAGIAAASVPLIVSVAAPLPVHAATVVFCNSACPPPCTTGNCGACCTAAFAGCGCCQLPNVPPFGPNDKRCTPVGPPGNENQFCIAAGGTNITCTG